ncbi:DUF3017 domain-containing protein [uncultured Tessaracoccus sp.]|uniref:DUF3017 domain-containing protein n=1 Tax=uncultured Tessaracoccus sp. TaxID=905023 RepID=UPI0025ECB150|nr:DUF3017 domain-containing protein [uncultured Tessaracoccus sp.]
MPEWDTLPDKPDRPAESAPSNPWPLLGVLVLVLVAVVFGVMEHWRRASVMVAVAMATAGGLRLVLPRRVAGLLCVRRRAFDVVAYFGLAIAITVVAFVVPPTN